MKRIAFMLLFSCAALFAQEKSWIVQKWLANCNDRVQYSLKLILNDDQKRVLNVNSQNIAQSCQGTLPEIVKTYFIKKEISYSVHYLGEVNFSSDEKDSIHRVIKKDIERFFAPGIVAKNQTDQGPVDIRFVVHLSKFPIGRNVAEIWYVHIDGNFYLNRVYNFDYSRDIIYDNHASLVQGITQNFGIIIREYAQAFQELNDSFRQKSDNNFH